MASNILAKGVRELRFIMCQSSAASAGTRSFIANNYTQMKAENPTLPFLVRECENAQPCVTARYDFGVERRMYLLGANEAEVGQAVNELVDNAKTINSAAAMKF